jgi:hypothetical protein
VSDELHDRGQNAERAKGSVGDAHRVESPGVTCPFNFLPELERLARPESDPFHVDDSGHDRREISDDALHGLGLIRSQPRDNARGVAAVTTKELS